MLSKLALDDAGMARCEDCGKLFEPHNELAVCRACARARGEAPPEPEVDAEALLREKTERLMQLFSAPTKSGVRLPRQVERPIFIEGPVCTRCRKREAIEESDFCLACHLELDNALGAASRDLLSRVEFIEPARRRVQGPSVFDTYGEKRTEANKNAVVPPHSSSPRSG